MNLNLYFKFVAKALCYFHPSRDYIISSQENQINQDSPTLIEQGFEVTSLSAFRQTFGNNYRLYLTRDILYPYQGGFVNTESVYIGTYKKEDAQLIRNAPVAPFQDSIVTRKNLSPREWEQPRVKNRIYREALQDFFVKRRTIPGLRLI